MKILSDHGIDCCDPDCIAHGITSAKGDLPPGWTFRRVPGDDAASVHVLVYCPVCSKARGMAEQSSGTE